MNNRKAGHPLIDKFKEQSCVPEPIFVFKAAMAKPQKIMAYSILGADLFIVVIQGIDVFNCPLFCPTLVDHLQQFERSVYRRLMLLGGARNAARTNRLSSTIL